MSLPLSRQPRWLTPVILALWEAEARESQGQEFETNLVNVHFGRLRQADHLMSGVQDQPDQHGETLSLLKIQKIRRECIECKTPSFIVLKTKQIMKVITYLIENDISDVKAESHYVAQAGLELLASRISSGERFKMADH
ncbi:hypothetical protein AAY473_001746 [Plecturocebus cupreus]